jgi:signal transduction histidine kinase
MSDLIPIILVTVLLFIVATGIIVFVLIYQKKQLQYMSERKQLKADYDKEILESRLEIQEQTMKSISQEVHDNIGQVLSVAKLNLNMIDVKNCAPATQEKINDVSELLRKAIQDLRDLSKSLHSDVIAANGLLKAIENEFDILKKTNAYAITLNIDGNYYHLPEQKELILFRIFQETINNIIKHAQAWAIDISVKFQPREFTLCIHDNGIGFNITGIDTSKGIGLKNIINRSQLIGAFYFIDSDAANGTTIKIILPIARNETAS